MRLMGALKVLGEEFFQGRLKSGKAAFLQKLRIAFDLGFQGLFGGKAVEMDLPKLLAVGLIFPGIRAKSGFCLFHDMLLDAGADIVQNPRNIFFVQQVDAGDDEKDAPQIAGDHLVFQKIPFGLGKGCLGHDDHQGRVDLRQHRHGDLRHGLIIVKAGGINDGDAVFAVVDGIVDHRFLYGSGPLLAFPGEFGYVIVELVNFNLLFPAVLVRNFDKGCHAVGDFVQGGGGGKHIHGENVLPQERVDDGAFPALKFPHDGHAEGILGKPLQNLVNGAYIPAQIQFGAEFPQLPEIRDNVCDSLLVVQEAAEGSGFLLGSIPGICFRDVDRFFCHVCFPPIIVLK